MNNFYFIFGDDRLYKYVKITAKDAESARKRMFLECGRQWAFMYKEEDFVEIMREYHLTELYHFTEN